MHLYICNIFFSLFKRPAFGLIQFHKEQVSITFSDVVRQQIFFDW